MRTISDGMLTILLCFFGLAGCHTQERSLGEMHPNAQCALYHEYFPPIGSNFSGDPQPIMSEFYRQELYVMEEQSLYVCEPRPQGVTYRLLWDRALMSQPMAKLQITPDGTSALTVKLMNHECLTAPPGSDATPCYVVEQHRVVLTPAQTAQALTLLHAIPWNDRLAQLAGRNSTDGADWVFEERNGDRYRYADFRQPTPAMEEFARLVFQDWSHLLP
jgi:hypothetical protein